ncbi:MAG: DUF2961 domain-containing protein, partial [Verrucomicrobia bacterium]|nr:DUF2961 domain-containing protein [Verrucomicrobiota bacterium]
GLEDYFNGGWYYRAVFQNPLYGLTLKRPFRTVQYRFHLPDVVTFEKELNMGFERGPGNTSRAAYDTTVYYYLEQPSEAFGDQPRQAWLNPPPDEFEARSLMTRLWDYEKSDDFSNAEKLTQHAVMYWKYPADIKAILSQRVQAYQAQRSGVASEEAMTIFVYSNKKSAVYLDGKLVLATSDPTRSRVAAVDVPAGEHVLSVETEAGAWPDWVQAGLKKGVWIMGIDSSWKCAVNPVGKWRDSSYDDSGWNQPFGTCKGPPEQEAVPFVYPDPYVGLQSKLDGVRARELPPGVGAKVVYRKVFEVD